MGNHLHGVINYGDVFTDLENHLYSFSNFLRRYKRKLTFILFRFDHSYSSQSRASGDEIFELIIKSLKEWLLLNDSNLIISGEFNFQILLSRHLFSTVANLLAIDQYPVTELCLGHLRKEHLRLLSWSQILCYTKILKVLNIEHGDLECEGVDYLPNCSYS